MNKTYLDNIPFGVYMCLKHLVKIQGGKVNEYKINSAKIR